MPAMTDAEAPAPRPMIRGERVWLRPSEPSDIINNAPYASDAEVGHFMGVKTPMSKAAAERFSAEIFSQNQGDQTGYGYAICLLGTEEGIGTVFLHSVDALNALVDFGFGELRLERIELEVFDFNERAIRSYQKAGFQTDAVQRHSRFHRGRHHDVHVMSILRDDWLAIERKRSWELAGP